MQLNSWRVGMSAATIVATLSLAACGGDDGADVRTIEDAGSGSGSGSTGSGSTGSHASEPGSGSGSAVESHSE